VEVSVREADPIHGRMLAHHNFHFELAGGKPVQLAGRAK
jgi:hypothetical protein